MKSKTLLLIDAVINLLLGILLIFYPKGIILFLGIPFVENTFYAKILGAVLFGIGLALWIERSHFLGLSGLGLGGAIMINICGGMILGFWLLFSSFPIPSQGQIILWILVIILMGLSFIELMTALKDTIHKV